MKNILIVAAMIVAMNVQSQETAGDFTTDVTKKVNIGYLLHRPENTKTKKPLIVFLHGSGEKGKDTEKIRVNGPV